MRRIAVFVMVMAMAAASLMAVTRSAAQQGYICISNFPTNWTTVGGEMVQYGTTPYGPRMFLTGTLVDNFGTQIRLAKADYPIAQYEGIRGVRSVTFSWVYSGFSLALADVGVQLIRGGALVDSYAEARQADGQIHSVTATFTDRPVDYLSAYIRYPTAGNPLGSVALRVEQICYYSARQDPTPTYIFTRTPTATRTATLTPSVTLTPSQTPINFTPPPTVPTALPTILMPTMESRGFVSPIPPDGSCTDLTQPCNLWPLPDVATLNIPAPTALPTWATLTPIPSYTYAYVPVPGEGSGTPTPTPGGGGLGDVIPPPLGTLSGDGIDHLSEMAGTTVYGAGTGNGEGVDLRQSGYEIGANVGALFGYARMLADADLGRVGTILSFLLLLIAFNLALRILLFIVPILFTIFRFIIDIIQTVVHAIDAVIPF